MAPKKKKEPPKPPAKPGKPIVGEIPKPKKIPPPPKCFTLEEILRYKEIFKIHDEEGIDKVMEMYNCLLDPTQD